MGASNNAPADIVAKLNSAINSALADPRLKARHVDLGGAAIAGTPSAFGTLIAEETRKWARVIKGAGIKPE